MLRLAAIEFLNAAPLMWGLEADPRFALFHTLPSACADALRDATADLGVIPVIELARIPDLVGLAGIGVAADSEVRSILLVSRRPAPEIQTLALDRASRTSAALVQILLRHRFAANFATQAGDANWQAALQRADAALVIGDPALRLRISGAAEAQGHHVYDLAREWRAWTGLPFVFAIWGVRRSVFAASQTWLLPRLRQALEQAAAQRDALVQIWAARLDLPASEVRRYLADNVVHHLTPAHLAGLRHFFALAAGDGLLAHPDLPPLEGDLAATP